MTPEQIELLRTRLLTTVRGAARHGASRDLCWMSAKQGAFTITPDQVETHLDYLADKQLIRVERSSISAALNRWFITAQGTDFLEGQGL